MVLVCFSGMLAVNRQGRGVGWESGGASSTKTQWPLAHTPFATLRTLTLPLSLFMKVPFLNSLMLAFLRLNVSSLPKRTGHLCSKVVG